MSTITLKDIGPHTRLEIQVTPGVNIVRGDNELGKSIAVRAVAALASGDTDSARLLPVRDGQRQGLVEGFGTTLIIGRRTTRAGIMSDVEPLASRIDLGALIEPGIKDPVAAMRKQIRALLTLTKTKLTWEEFLKILPGEHQEAIDEDFADDDPVELAQKVKRSMEKKAREWKSKADEADTAAKTARAACHGLDLTQPSDDESLQAAYQQAVEHRAKLAADTAAANRAAASRDAAREKLAELGALPDLVVLTEKHEAAVAHVANLDDRISAMRTDLRLLENDREHADKMRLAVGEHLIQAKQQHEAVSGLTEAVDAEVPPAPHESALTAAVESVRKAVEQGALVRRAWEKSDEAAEYDKVTSHCLSVEQIYRNAAHATDAVLSDAVSSGVFRIQEGRLQAQDHNEVWRDYMSLSEGARAKIALQAISETRGESDELLLATLDQTYWDGQGTRNRDIINEEAKAHNIAIVTGEVCDGPLEVVRWSEVQADVTPAVPRKTGKTQSARIA
jgi:hypothetical protein